ncbi:hypothetical protein SAMN05660297_02248 [Natronincola peptidivorans]|uniref:Uncharacterized protein n=1 Tax=Natronincola peptidivorans TaxID=426128 RepID=A0A1I0E070_9FIRM|nr:hypothetical protein [Natronincola peptidivorans]SET38420.1 hypothetical protein SAMN05660297_02248 [Natronincola peptidivorans]
MLKMDLSVSDQLREKEDAIERCLDKIEKARIILGRWEDEYVFREKPIAEAAIKFGSVRGPKTAHQRQSFKWFHEYENIKQFVRIANDYVTEVKELLEKCIIDEELKE